MCYVRGKDMVYMLTLFAAAVTLTGNNFDKIVLFCKFLGIDFISRSLFNKHQTYHVVPAIREFWNVLKGEVWRVLNNEAVILCGGWT